MKVKDLIRETQWMPGSSYNNSKFPIVSVLLPTFRRAKSGKLRNAIESVLSQTLADLELIIVDDASTDGSADIISEFMAKDGRVSCLRHPQNIGLPAISEYEAYSKSRGSYIAFAFDDDIFFPDALQELYVHAQTTPDQVVYGSVAMRVNELGSGEDKVEHLGASLSTNNINSWNFIANNAVLVPRFIFEDIGLYDPHILMTRVCDWDLWRRISRKYILRYVEVSVGEVGGPATEDSLGKTYALDSWASEERIKQERNFSLRPENIGEYDIFALPEFTSYCTAVTSKEMAVAHARTRQFIDIKSSQLNSNDSRKVLVLSCHYDASTTVTFDYLPEYWKSRIRVIRPWNWPIAEIAHASCLIVVRQLEPFSEWVEAAKKMQIPCYYFIDDNLTLLQEDKEVIGFEDVSKPTLRRKLSEYSGVLTSTSTLYDYFEEHLLHPNIMMFPPAFCDLKIVADERAVDLESLVIAFAGGGHRLSALQDIVVPALLRYVESGRRIKLVVGGATKALVEVLEQHERLEVVAIPHELNWESALLQIAKHSPDILIHAPSTSSNNIYKTMNVAKSADVVGAALVVPDYFPYSQVKDLNIGYVVSSPFSARSWSEMLESLDVSSISKFKENNKKYCAEMFSGMTSSQVLDLISKKATFNGFTTVENRLKILARNHSNINFITTNDSLKSPRKLIHSLEELARWRHAASVSKRLGFMARKHDLWDSLMPEFRDLKAFSVSAKKGGTGIVLEMSKSLHDIPYLEYPINSSKKIKSILLAFATDGFQDGLIGIELVGASGEIILNKFLSLHSLDLSSPVEFRVDDGNVDSSAEYKLRVFARASHPVYIFELVKYRYAGLKRLPVYPFVEISTV
ncbi:MAG TPA: glycosyltransferase [Pseudomonas sp.]|uniref:glycosyltransferase family 2 protein n=1 Tax=Pseudomonas sp. TaxID=306 RepID=UPI002C54B100|nr:glycosyltransferase [Pseudomonas sp.]HWH88321.1 glycosyltransferase [Pseudomonas sp.]